MIDDSSFDMCFHCRLQSTADLYLRICQYICEVLKLFIIRFLIRQCKEINEMLTSGLNHSKTEVKLLTI